MKCNICNKQYVQLFSSYQPNCECNNSLNYITFETEKDAVAYNKSKIGDICYCEENQLFAEYVLLGVFIKSNIWIPLVKCNLTEIFIRSYHIQTSFNKAKELYVNKGLEIPERYPISK